MNKTDPRIAASMFSIPDGSSQYWDGDRAGTERVYGGCDWFLTTFIILAGLNLLAFPLVGLIFGRRQAVAAPIS